MMFFISCNSSKIVEKTTYYVPEVDFPEFPKLPDYEITEKGILIKDENYFRQLLIFKTIFENEVNKYNEKKEKIEEANEGL